MIFSKGITEHDIDKLFKFPWSIWVLDSRIYFLFHSVSFFFWEFKVTFPSAKYFAVVLRNNVLLCLWLRKLHLGCYDISPFCAKNKHQGRCDQSSWKWFMTKECRRTCGICGHGTTPTKPTQSTKETKTITASMQLTKATKPGTSKVTAKPTTVSKCKWLQFI